MSATCSAKGGIERVGGHPEIELGLVELARVTGGECYLHQASLFIDRRGHHTLADIHWGRSYFQDDVPIRDQVAFIGHSVDALRVDPGSDLAVSDGVVSASGVWWRSRIVPGPFPAPFCPGARMW